MGGTIGVAGSRAQRRGGASGTNAGNGALVGTRGGIWRIRACAARARQCRLQLISKLGRATLGETTMMSVPWPCVGRSEDGYASSNLHLLGLQELEWFKCQVRTRFGSFLRHP